jgi:hypothetical protein
MTKLTLEPHNHRVDSTGWKKKTVDGVEFLVSPCGGITEYTDGEDKGEQLFSWDAAIREAKKAGKRIPTDEEWSELLKIKSDMPNLVFAGLRDTDGSFAYRATYAYFWASSQFDGTTAWRHYLGSSYATVYRYPVSKQYGFSLRCLEDSSDSLHFLKSQPIEVSVKFDGTTYGKEELEKKITEVVAERDEKNKWLKTARKALVKF